MMKAYFKHGVLLIVLAGLLLPLAPRRAAAQETQEAPTPSTKLATDISNVEGAYVNVVRYYNQDLSDFETQQIVRSILYYSGYYGIDPRLVVSVIVVESRFRPRAVSPKGAMGLGQLMPGTARTLGVWDCFDIQQNVYGTVRYLRAQYDRFSQVEERVLDYMLAAYNAGPEAVARHGGVPPYRETQNYVTQVKRLYRFFVYGA